MAEPDRAAAVAAYEKACQLGEARGCLEAARLYQRGYMFEVERKRDRARELANEAHRKSVGCNGTDACVVSFDAQVMMLELNPWSEQTKATGAQLLADAQKTCEKSGESCSWVYENVSMLAGRGFVERKDVDTIRDKAATAVESLCKRTNAASACYWAGKYARGARKLEQEVKYFDTACKAGYKDACWELWDAKLDSAKPGERGPLIKEAIAQLVPACDSAPTKQCGEIAELFASGYEMDGTKIPKDVGKALRLIESACKSGEQDACDGLGRLYREGKVTTADPAKAKQFLARACRLSEPEDTCRLCDAGAFPTAPECQLRTTWYQARSCEVGDESACDAVGNAFRGKGGLHDNAQAARYYRRACDSAVKTACSSIDEMCVAGEVDETLCQQSLIHTDLFYEAEWQFRHTGKATLASGEEAVKNLDKVAGLDSPQGGGPPGASFKRGSLDADLVVSIVLDRARQAALELVVDELMEAGSGRVAGYLRDLLGQAALLLADSNTLRREKLTDLARTVVRALLASNLVNTMYPDPDELLNGKLLAEWAGKPWDLKWRPEHKERLRRYLTDWTYHLLGETKLFAGAGTKIAVKLPACPFGKPHAQLCEWLVDKDKPNYERLGELLHLNRFVDGLALARMIRNERSVDLRRLIEALGRSKQIANFNATPGLNLATWERELVGGVEYRLRDLREEIEAIARLADTASYTTTPAWSDLQKWGRTTRRLLSDKGAAALFSRDQQYRLNDLARLITGPPVGPPPPRPPGSTVATVAAVAGATVEVASEDARAQKLTAEILAKLGTWDTTTRNDLTKLIRDLRLRIDNVAPHITKLQRQIDEIRGTLKRLAHNQLSIDEIPLSTLPELNESLDGALTELKKLDGELRNLFPGTTRTQMRFAISAVVRLRGFLSLMDRISRRAPLNQTVSELMASVKMLGNVRKGRFSAPLFDVIEPALDVIVAHRPLDADVLFSMVSRARLDSLITSLEGESHKRPCERDEGGTECWTVKVIHALQESVQRDGEMIRVDGGQFARRLAAHGDDFRKKHKWGSFFHLTVGIGGMYSTDPPQVSMTGEVTEGKNRTVPIVAEQIGFGLASPTFWKDKLTFKLGLFGSGILYRMVLDSSESNAVSLGGFMALDIKNYVELFIAPALLLYPPEGDRSITPTLGVSAGIQVPLGAYLEKLGD